MWEVREKNWEHKVLFLCIISVFSSKSGWDIFFPVYVIITLSRFLIICVKVCLDYLMAHFLFFFFFQWLWLWICLEAGFDFYIWSLLMEDNVLTVQSIFTTVNWSSFIYLNHLPWEFFVGTDSDQTHQSTRKMFTCGTNNQDIN